MISLLTVTAILCSGCGTDTDKNPNASMANQQEENVMLTLEEAQAKALVHAGLVGSQVTFVKGKLDYEHGRQVYEIEFYTQDGKEYDYELDPYTGEVVGFDYDAEGSLVNSGQEQMTSGNHSGSGSSNGNSVADNGITADKAKELALARVKGATLNDIREFKTDYDDGRTEYEGKIIYDGVEYEFEIDAATGNFLDWEEETLGR